jgi:hypothetical protein
MFDIIEASPYFSTRTTIFTVTTQAQQIVANEPQRVCLYFSAPATGPFGLLLSSAGSYQQSFAFVNQNTTVRFQWPLDGVITTLPMWAINASGPVAVSVTEVWFRPPRGQH